MGLPTINVEFYGKAVTAVSRSAMGIVALLLRDETNLAVSSVVTIKSVEDLNTADWTPENYDYIEKTLRGTPSKVVGIKLSEKDAEPEGLTLQDALKKLGSVKFNYLSMPAATNDEAALLASWIKSKRATNKKTYKAVLANQSADDMGVVNFTTTGIKVGVKAYATQEYTCRIAGILAGLPFTQSSTYFVLPEVTEIEEHEDPDAAIDAGELILHNDGEKIKIGRGVNSLVTVTAAQKADYKKIKVVEAMDMMKDDIRSVYEDSYVGKVNNIYDNQVLFIGAVNAYFKELAAEGVLDQTYENVSFIDAEKQRLAWESSGTDTTDWEDQKVREMSFADDVFLAGNVKIVDAMEDLDFNILTV